MKETQEKAVRKVDEPQEEKKVAPRFHLRVAALMSVLSAIMCIGAFADDASGGDSLTGGVSSIISLVGQVVQLITGNSILMVFLGAALLSVAIAVFVRLFRSLRH